MFFGEGLYRLCPLPNSFDYSINMFKLNILYIFLGSFVCTTCHHYGEWSSLRRKVLSDAKCTDL